MSDHDLKSKKSEDETTKPVENSSEQKPQIDTIEEWYNIDDQYMRVYM